jgi:hypothetical protein
MTQTRDIACTLLGRDGRYVQIALDTKGHCQGPAQMTPDQHSRRGRKFAAEFMLKTAIRKQFGSVTHLFRNVLGMDERTLDDLTKEETDFMPYDRRRTSADRRRPFRAMDENEDPTEYLRELIQGLEPEEAQALIESLSGDRRRTARDNPPEFEGMPRTGGSMVGEKDEVFDKHWRRPGESRQAADARRRFAHDQASGSRASRDAADDFRRRFPSAAGIRVMG